MTIPSFCYFSASFQYSFVLHSVPSILFCSLFLSFSLGAQTRAPNQNMEQDRAIGYGPVLEPDLPSNTWRNEHLYGWELPTFYGYWRPRADIMDLGDSLRVEVELPGIDEDSISLEVSDKTLILSARKPQTRREANAYHHQNERRFGRFFRKLELPFYVDIASTQNTDAIMSSGVLRLTLLKDKQRPAERGGGERAAEERRVRIRNVRDKPPKERVHRVGGREMAVGELTGARREGSMETRVGGAADVGAGRAGIPAPPSSSSST
ncbi:hypothetical protein QOT17_000705 [Balamuthia mandrillaris]